MPDVSILEAEFREHRVPPRMHEAGPNVFSRDGPWSLDGSRRTSNKLPEAWWRRFFTGLERLRGWLLAWVVIAVVAGARYHS